MTAIAVLIPGILFCLLRHKLLGYKMKNNFESIQYVLLEFICGIVLVNALTYLVWQRLQPEIYDIYAVIAEYVVYACKYIVTGVGIAVGIVLLETIIKKVVKCNRFVVPEKVKKLLVVLYVVVMGAHHFVRMFTTNFWGDEGYTILASRMSWDAMLGYVAENGHTPLHYIIVWLFCRVFGESAFVYHLSSTLPYFIMLVVALVVVWKWFGAEAVIIFSTLATFLDFAIVYNLEVRMYVWCQMFIFLAFLVVYKLLHTKENKYYVWLSLLSIAAVNAHYFALASIGMMYVVILYYVMKEDIRSTWKVIVSGGSVLIGFCPWALYNYFFCGRVMSNYGITADSLSSCIQLIFSTEHWTIVFAIFVIALILAILYEKNIITFRDGDGELSVDLVFTKKEKKSNPEILWMISGLSAVIGTIIVSKAISELMFPILLLRYVYPAYVVIWLLLGVVISKCKLRKVYTVILVLLILIPGYQVWSDMYKSEISSNIAHEATLEATREYINEDAFIHTDVLTFNGTIVETYYPDTEHVWVDIVALPWMHPEKENWLFWSTPIPETVQQALYAQGYEAELVIENGCVGVYYMQIYIVVPIDGGM